MNHFGYRVCLFLRLFTFDSTSRWRRQTMRQLIHIVFDGREMFLAELLYRVAHYLIRLECTHPLIYNAVICI